MYKEHTVENYIKNYKSKVIDDLVINKLSGCSRKLTNEQEKAPVDLINNNTHDEVGFK
ncbi:hypothetical protein [Clostridium saccharoperbutylacetonicum]